MGRERMSIPTQIERQGNHGQQSGFDLPRMLDGSEGDVSMRSKPPVEHDFTWVCERVPAAASNTAQANSKLFGEETAES